MPCRLFAGKSSRFLCIRYAVRPANVLNGLGGEQLHSETEGCERIHGCLGFVVSFFYAYPVVESSLLAGATLYSLIVPSGLAVRFSANCCISLKFEIALKSLTFV